MGGESDDFRREQGQRPACPPSGWLRARRGDQERFVRGREFPFSAGPRVLRQGPVQAVLDKMLLGAIDRRGPHLQRRGNLRVGHARRGRQENLGAFHAPHRPCAAGDQGFQLLTLALLQLHAVS